MGLTVPVVLAITAAVGYAGFLAAVVALVRMRKSLERIEGRLR